MGDWPDNVDKKDYVKAGNGIYKYMAVCPNCGKQHYVRNTTIGVQIKKKRIVGRCLKWARKTKSGSGHHNWKGGRRLNDLGYIVVRMSKYHSFATMRMKDTGQVSEHRLVVAESLGRPLTSDEHVHHINGIRDDNRIENLQLTTRSKHRLLY